MLDNTIHKECNAVDLCKFICAILVVIIHVNPLGISDITLIKYVNYGLQQYVARIAVPLFFVSSGFFLYNRTSISDFNLSYTKKYLKNILRLYLLWSIIYLPLVAYGIYKNHPKGVFHAVLGYLRNFLLVGSYTQLWYLNALIVAVIIVSYLLYKKVSIKTILIISFSLYFVGLFAQSWFGFIRPLSEFSPQLWNFLKIVQKVIVTTRNGIFEGFFFVSIGMYFAMYDVKIKRSINIVMIILSMLLMGVEVAILEYHHFILGHDMYLMLLPAVYFIFAFVINLDLEDRNIYIYLRRLSALIFYTHLLVAVVITKMIKIISPQYTFTYLVFVLTLLASIVISAMIIKASECRNYEFLKKLYI